METKILPPPGMIGSSAYGAPPGSNNNHSNNHSADYSEDSRAGHNKSGHNILEGARHSGTSSPAKHHHSGEHSGDYSGEQNGHHHEKHKHYHHRGAVLKNTAGAADGHHHGHGHGHGHQHGVHATGHHYSDGNRIFILFNSKKYCSKNIINWRL